MLKTNVLFIIPPYLAVDEILTGEPESWLANCAAPLGVLSIAAYIDKYAEVNLMLLDLNASIVRRSEDFLNSEWHEFLKEEMSALLTSPVPHIVGISSIFNSQLGYLQLISEYSKTFWPEALVTTGGGGPSNLSQEVFDMAPCIDAIAFGEAEKPFLNLVNADNREEFLESNKAWITRKRLQTGEVFSHDYVENLDDIPFFKYDLLDKGFGVNREIDGQCYNKKDGDKEKDNDQGNFLNRKLSYVKEGTVAASLMTSRGCPFSCTFCSSHTIHGKQIRYHSVERVVEDGRRLRAEYGVNTLLFEDDLFFADRKKSIAIIKKLGAEGFELDFSGGLSVIHLNHDDVVVAMKNAGVRVVKLAVESGNERVLKELIKKPYRKLSLVKKVVKRLRDNDIFIRAFWVIGHPGETKEEIFESLRFFKETGFNWVSIMIVAPIAGSELYRICKEKNLLVSDRRDTFHFGKANIRLAHSTPEEFERLRYLLNLEANFVENYDLCNGHPNKALLGLEDVLSRVPNHAFAAYYISECYRQMGDGKNAETYLVKYFDIVRSHEKWREYANHFGLPLSRSQQVRSSIRRAESANTARAQDFSTGGKISKLIDLD